MVLLTATTMVVEIIAGWLTNSMAVLADGWHMGTHVVALGIAAFAYWYVRKHTNDPQFAFGTWKVGVLAGVRQCDRAGVGRALHGLTVQRWSR